MLIERIFLGKMDYQKSLKIMDQKISESVQQKTAFFIGLEYEKVYTCGIRFSKEHLLDQNLSLIHVRRGGSITLHNKGQLVVYTVIPFDAIKRDLPGFIRLIEDSIIEFLKKDFGITSFTKKGKSGVFTHEGKIAYIGLSVKKNIVFHGFAVNIINNLLDYDAIHSCGLKTPNTNIKNNSKDSKNLFSKENLLIEIFQKITNILVKNIMGNDIDLNYKLMRQT